MPLLCIVLMLLCTLYCADTGVVIADMRAAPSNTNPYQTVDAIPMPAGYKRTEAANNSFAAWLRRLPLKADKTVYLYNAEKKANQAAQFAVLNISTGKKDLQQCADAVMRLRAEYLYSYRQFNAIDFADNNHKHYLLPADATRADFDRYLEKVFSFCGTASLEKQLLPVPDLQQVQAGDVLIKGGSPGHAMLVMDVAVNDRGEKIFMLAQSYMPAQDIHIVVNPLQRGGSPWYPTINRLIETPEWTFYPTALRKWTVN